MKVFIKENTRIAGEHLQSNKVHDLDEQHALFLVKLGRAEHVKEKVKVEEIVTKTDEVLEHTNTNKEVELSKRVSKRTKKEDK